MFNYVINAAKRCYNFVSEKLGVAKVATGTALMVAASSASAAVPADVTTAITTGATDVATLGSAILTVIVAIVGFNWLRRVIK